MEWLATKDAFTGIHRDPLFGAPSGFYSEFADPPQRQ